MARIVINHARKSTAPSPRNGEVAVFESPLVPSHYAGVLHSSVIQHVDFFIADRYPVNLHAAPPKLDCRLAKRKLNCIIPCRPEDNVCLVSSRTFEYASRKLAGILGTAEMLYCNNFIDRLRRIGSNFMARRYPWAVVSINYCATEEPKISSLGCCLSGLPIRSLRSGVNRVLWPVSFDTPSFVRYARLSLGDYSRRRSAFKGHWHR